MPGSIPSTARIQPGFDPATLLEIVGDDREFLREFVEVFEKDSDRLSGEILESVSRSDARGLEDATHALKGILSHLGESVALELAARLEILGSRRDFTNVGVLTLALLAEIDLIRLGLAKL